jgi:DNA (cytosine-5)-methyltransferase 1
LRTNFIISDGLLNKGCLKYEYPKDIQELVSKDGGKVNKGEYRLDLAKGYDMINCC